MRREPFKVAGTIITFGMIGVIVSAMFEHFYNEGILIDEFITGSIVITDLMIWIIVPFILIGVVLGVLKYG